MLIGTPETIDDETQVAVRFRGLKHRRVYGFDVVVAPIGLGRFLGLRGCRRARSPQGLLLPFTDRTNTYGMAFRVDLLFFGPNWEPLTAIRKVGHGKRIHVPGAKHLLILPSDWETSPAVTEPAPHTRTAQPA